MGTGDATNILTAGPHSKGWTLVGLSRKLEPREDGDPLEDAMLGGWWGMEVPWLSLLPVLQSLPTPLIGRSHMTQKPKGTVLPMKPSKVRRSARNEFEGKQARNRPGKTFDYSLYF